MLCQLLTQNRNENQPVFCLPWNGRNCNASNWERFDGTGRCGKLLFM
jgi:hypothetical protein